MSEDAVFRLGMDLDPVSGAAREQVGYRSGRAAGAPAPRKDYFIERDGRVFAGMHLVVDVVDGGRLDELDHVEETLTRCVEAAGATLLHLHLHHFTPNDGISGVAVLAESHISIHTWPERGYAALDVFMCGAARPEAAVDVLREAFAPRDIRVRELFRGEDL